MLEYLPHVSPIVVTGENIPCLNICHMCHPQIIQAKAKCKSALLVKFPIVDLSVSYVSRRVMLVGVSCLLACHVGWCVMSDGVSCRLACQP